jgi:hypothetical protein
MTDSSYRQSRTWDITNQRKLPTTIKGRQQREHRNRNTKPEDKVNNPSTKHDYLQPSKITNTESSQPRYHVGRQVNNPTGNNVTPDVSYKTPTYTLTYYSLHHIFNERCE